MMATIANYALQLYSFLRHPTNTNPHKNKLTKNRFSMNYQKNNWILKFV